jgi:hypothetical protein
MEFVITFIFNLDLISQRPTLEESQQFAKSPVKASNMDLESICKCPQNQSTGSSSKFKLSTDQIRKISIFSSSRKSSCFIGGSVVKFKKQKFNTVQNKMINI